MIENARLQNEEDETMWRESLIKLYLNLAICCLKQAKSPRAITYCRKVLELQPNNAKAFFRLGQVCITDARTITHNTSDALTIGSTITVKLKYRYRFSLADVLIIDSKIKGDSIIVLVIKGDAIIRDSAQICLIIIS